MIPSPYSTDDDLIAVQFKVSRKDYENLRVRYPFRGFTNALFANLYKRLLAKLDEHSIPTHYHPDNAERILALAEGLTFPRPPRKRRDGDDGRRTPRLRENGSGKAHVSGSTPEHHSEGIKEA